MALPSETFDLVKARLQDRQNGEKFIKHLGAIIDATQQMDKQNPIDKFEEYSLILKKTAPHSKENKPANTVLINWIQENLKATHISAPLESGFVPNLLDDFSILEWAGVSFPSCQIQLLQKSLQKIAFIAGPIYVKFWGKIFGRKKDYYIIETNGDKPEDEETPEDNEKRGKGVNERIYYATNSLLEEWTQLPDVTPEQIRMSRKFKRILTGDLEADVEVYPFFKGKEKHLLRAQIARISHATTLTPKGLYTTSAETQEIIPADDAPMPTFEELSVIESWIHLLPNILLVGRISHYVDPKKEEAEKELEELKTKDPILDPLKSIAEDESILLR